MEKDFLLDGYEYMLQKAIDNLYQFVGFKDYKNSFEKSCLLRHDIDSELWGCLDMAQIEHRLGIQSTYFVMLRSTSYNLFCVESISTIENLLKMNHFLGLHFMGELIENKEIPFIQEKVSYEVDMVEREFGIQIDAVSFHQPSQIILNNNIPLDLKINTYNKLQLSDYFYISDSNMIWKHEHPYEVFCNSIYKKLQLLIHPIWWSNGEMTLMEKWRKTLFTNRQVVLKHWLEREATLKNVTINDLI